MNKEEKKIDPRWCHFFFPETIPEKFEKVEFPQKPICCGQEMFIVPTDCVNPVYVCDICMADAEVE